MIDTDKYEGHTEGEWMLDDCDWNWAINIFGNDGETIEANATLIADAPLLLAEVKRLREIIGVFDEFMCNNWMPSNSYPHAPSPFDNVHSLWNELLWRVEEE